jgi:hypothetical protein
MTKWNLNQRYLPFIFHNTWGNNIKDRTNIMWPTIEIDEDYDIYDDDDFDEIAWLNEMDQEEEEAGEEFIWFQGMTRLSESLTTPTVFDKNSINYSNPGDDMQYGFGTEFNFVPDNSTILASDLRELVREYGVGSIEAQNDFLEFIGIDPQHTTNDEVEDLMDELRWSSIDLLNHVQDGGNLTLQDVDWLAELVDNLRDSI